MRIRGSTKRAQTQALEEKEEEEGRGREIAVAVAGGEVAVAGGGRGALRGRHHVVWCRSSFGVRLCAPSC